MRDNFEFSVVIPVYNGAAFIKRAIDSCLQQTLLPREIIVIDDASTDQTEREIKSVGSPLVSYSRNAENQGPSFSRNAGLRLARSEWVAFLDADDIFHHQKLEIINNCLQNNAGIKIIGHSFDLLKPGNTSEMPKGILPKRLSLLSLLLRNPMVTPSFVIAACNNLFFDEQLKYAEDHDFILRSAEKYGAWYLPVPLCSLGRIPLSSGGLSSRKWDMRKGEMRMLVNFCKRNGMQVLIPLLLGFSLLKHLKSKLIG